MDADGRFVGLLVPSQAKALVERGRATIEGKGRRAFVQLSRAHIEDFEGERWRGGMNPVDVERHAQQRVVVLKRIDPRSGALVSWDNNLSFEELRAGRLKSRRGALEHVMSEAA
jgi:hypothetical protein